MLNRWPMLKEVLHLLMPMVLTLTLELSISLVDTLMLGNYSPYHLAAVGLASSLWTPVGCFLMGITFGLTPLVTRHLHGRQMKMVNIYMSQTLGVCLTIGVLAALTIAFILPYFAVMMASEEETQRVSVQYLQILAPAIPALALTVGYKNLFEAAGRPNFPLIAAGIGLLMNAGLNYVFIYGNFGFPEMGAAGAALASTISIYFSITLFFVYDKFFSEKTLFTKIKTKYLFKFGILLNVGLPAGLAFSFEIGLFSSMTWLISSFGDLAIGAGQIVMSYTSILFTPLMAMSAVTAIVVAKALSKEGVEGVRKRMRVIVGLGLVYVFVCFVITQVFSDVIPRFFTDDPKIIAMAAALLLISSTYQVVDMLQTVFTGGLRGFRDTRFSMIAFAISLFVLCLPLGYWLAHFSPWAAELNVRGFYIGLGSGLALLSLLLILRFRFVVNRAMLRKVKFEEAGVIA